MWRWSRVWRHNSDIFLVNSHLRCTFLFFKFSGELKMADWEDVIITVAKVLDSTPGDRMAALVGGMADAETLVALKDLFNRLGCEDLCTESSFPMDYGGKSKLSFGSTA